MTRQDTTGRDGSSEESGADATQTAFGGSRVPIAGGAVLVGAVAGNLLVQALVAGGTLPPGTDETLLPVFGVIAVIGLLTLVGSVVRR